MTMSDPIGDMLARIRNGQAAGKTAISVPASKLRERVLEVLQREGYIRGFSLVERRSVGAELTVELKYHEGAPVIREITRVSKPGRRVYSKVGDLPKVSDGLGIAILSTPRGVMSDSEARAANVGGEILCQVF